MIQLVAYSQGSDTPTFLDVTEATAVTLQMEFANPAEPFTRSSTYSTTFTVPDTQKNSAFFSHYYDANIADGTFDARVRTSCNILDDGALVMEGFLQMLGHSTKSRTFQVSVVGGAGDLFSRLADIALGDIFDADYDVVPSPSKVIDSWTLTNDVSAGSVGAGLIVFPYIDYGNSDGNRLFYDEGVADGVAAPNYVRAYHFKPAMQVKHMIEKVIQYGGKTIESTFLSTSDFESLYMTYNTQSVNPITRPLYGAKRYSTSNIDISDATTFHYVPFLNITGDDFYDPDEFMTTGDFIAPAQMNATFNVSLQFANAGSTQGYVDVMVTRATIEVHQQSYIVPAAGGVMTFSVNNIFIDNGEAVQVHVLGGTNLSVVGGVQTFLRFVEYNAPSSFAAINTTSALPNVKAADWLKEIAKRFNLAIVSKNNEPDVLQIEPLNDYLLSGTSRDWTAKVDHSQSVQVKPTTELKVKDLVYSDGIDEDHVNQWYNTRIGGVLGTYTYLTEDAFATGASDTDSMMGATGMLPIPSVDPANQGLTNVAIPMLYGMKDGAAEPVNHKPRLLFYNGLHSIGHTFYIGNTAHTSYPHFSPFSDRVVGSDTTSVLWRDNYRFNSAVIGSTFATGLVEKYWSAYLREIYSKEARLMTCSLVLNTSDVYNLSFADTITIKNTQYRLLSVSGLNVAKGGTCTAELLKVVQSSVTHITFDQECEDSIDSFNADGTTSWVDSSGASVSANEDCCRAAGYQFANGQCWWNFSDTGGTDSGGFGGTSAPSSTSTGDSIKPIVVPPTTAIEKSSAGGTRFPYALGTQGLTSRSSFFSTVQEQHYILQGVSNSTAAVSLNPYGRSTSGIILPRMAQSTIEVEVIGTDIAGTVDPVGDYCVTRKVFVATHTTSGLVRNQTDETVYEYKTSSRASLPTITLSAVAGEGDYSGINSTLEIKATGLADTITTWTAQVTMLVTDLGGARMIQDAIVTEDHQLIETENGLVCITEG